MARSRSPSPGGRRSASPRPKDRSYSNEHRSNGKEALERNGSTRQPVTDRRDKKRSRSRSPVQRSKRSPPARHRSRSRSPAPAARRRSRSPAAAMRPRSRSPAPAARRRSRSPATRRSRSPVAARRRSRSPPARRSRSPPARRSRSPPARRSRSPPPRRDQPLPGPPPGPPPFGQNSRGPPPDDRGGGRDWAPRAGAGGGGGREWDQGKGAYGGNSGNGRDGRDLPTQFGGRGGGFPEPHDAADISDDDVRAKSMGNFQEYRRLKRVKMWERNWKPLWRTTPSPPRDVHYDPEIPKEYIALLGASKHKKDRSPSPDREAAALAAAHAAAARGGAAVKEGSLEPPSHEELRKIDQEESEIFKAWLDARIAATREAAERDQEEGGGVAGDDDMTGPSLPGAHKAGGGGDFGGFLRPGEGERMAAYVASGKRIPRRGEVGLSSDEIERFETLGYIMSGSRHSRMNAIRLRKENQIYTAEEKAALAMFNYEENKRKEAKVLEDMKALVARTLHNEDAYDEAAGPQLPPSAG